MKNGKESPVTAFPTANNHASIHNKNRIGGFSVKNYPNVARIKNNSVYLRKIPIEKTPEKAVKNN